MKQENKRLQRVQMWNISVGRRWLHEIGRKKDAEIKKRTPLRV